MVFKLNFFAKREFFEFVFNYEFKLLLLYRFIFQTISCVNEPIQDLIKYKLLYILVYWLIEYQ